MPGKKKESIYIEAFARKKQNKQLQTSTLPSNRSFKSSSSLVFCRHLHVFGSSMPILCRPVGRQHKQQLRHRSKLVMNSADIRTTRPVRLLHFILYPGLDKINFRVFWVKAHLWIRWSGRHCNFFSEFCRLWSPREIIFVVESRRKIP